MLPPGEVIAERFTIETQVAAGGLGTVYRAIDRLSGEPVALKFLPLRIPELDERFAREAKILAEIRHPGLVRYVAHGTTAGGANYLAMEWLTGEDLARRIERGGISTADALAIAEKVADALGALHERGVIHRDIKPANLWLVDGVPENVKILDLGIAHAERAPIKLTQTGEQIGTPAYMAPEQVRGDEIITPAVDVFALGCVLHECLTGRPVFSGKNGLAVMARVVFAEAAPLHEARPELPDALERLVARMLDKDPAARPAGGKACAEALRAIERQEGKAAHIHKAPALTASERRLVSVVLAAPGRTRRGDEPTKRLWAAAERHGARIEALVDGSVVAVLASTGWAGDLAARAARCALAMRRSLPDAPMALATGRAVIATRAPLDDVIDSAAALLRARGSAEPELLGEIRLDEATAGLLDARFEISGDGFGLGLRAERPLVERVRTLAGKPTPCVGRERELAMLEAIFDECVAEPVARVILITSPPGFGKSRVRHELLRKLKARPAPTGEARRGSPDEERSPQIEVWIGRGDPMSAGSPFGLLAQALRGAANILEGEAPAAQQAKLRARVARHTPPAEVARVTELLGELTGAPFADDPAGGQLGAARRDPVIMGDQMRRALEDFVRAEAKAQPVVLVLEDLHWGDLPTVKFIDSTLRAAHDRPFLVLAMARPDVHDLFPGLWQERGLQEVRLGEITRKAAIRLIQAVLGTGVADEITDTLVERAAGNVFFLEELIRAIHDGGDPFTEEFPATIIAMMQTRLEALPAEARRVLRAASVFGQAFWKGGVEALLGEDAAGAAVWIELLVEKELVRTRQGGRFSDETELVFQHATVRDAAYEMLTTDDRRVGHRLAAAWLAKKGEPDALTLAEHHERGMEPAQAIRWYGRAAEQALEGNDLAAVIARAERGVACGADDEDMGRLRLLQAVAHGFGGDNLQRAQCAVVAWQLLPRGGEPWFAATAELAVASRLLGHRDTLIEAANDLLTAPASAVIPRAVALLRAGGALIEIGDGELGARLVAAAGDQPAALADPAVAAWLHTARALQASLDGDLEACLRETKLSARAFVAVVDLRSACLDWAKVGYLLVELGQVEEAESILRELLLDAERMPLTSLIGGAQLDLALALLRQGRLAESIAFAEQAIRIFLAQVDPRAEGFARQYLARASLELGHLDRAELEIARAVELHHDMPPALGSSLAAQASVRLARDDRAGALAAATAAMQLLENGQLEEGEAYVRLLHVQALTAAGAHEPARVALQAAAARLQARATRISDAKLRTGFLSRIPEHARTLALAHVG